MKFQTKTMIALWVAQLVASIIETEHMGIILMVACIGHVINEQSKGLKE